MDLESVLDIFKFLSSPFDNDSATKHLPGDTRPNPEALIQSITEYCMKHIDLLESSRSLAKDADINLCSSWKLTCVILSLLSKLKDAVEEAELQQTEEEKAIDVLSIQAQINIQKSVEIVIGFGILPNLLPGVGVPEKLRKMNPCVPYFLSDAKNATPYEQFLRLAHTLEILLICSSHPSLNALVVPKYASDILAGLLQICKSPIAQPKSDVAERKTGALTVEQYDNVMNVRAKIQDLMSNTFLVSVPKTTLVSSLFIIGAAEKPRWMCSSCNEILGNLILSENGLIIVVTTMLETSGRSDMWKLMRVISSLMINSLVKSGNPSCNQTLNSFVEQCVYMIIQNQCDDLQSVENVCNMLSNTRTYSLGNDTQQILHGMNLELMRVSLYCGLTLMNLDFNHVRSIFWDRLFYQLRKLDSCQNQEKVYSSTKAGNASKNSSVVSISFQNAVKLASYAEVLLSIVKPMNICIPLVMLQPVWSLFFQIFVTCKSYLQKRVQEPNVATAAEQLHHKLRDVLISLFEIYGSGSGQNLVVSSTSSANSATAHPSIRTSSQPMQPSQSVNLCDFCIMLVLNEHSEGLPILNTFDIHLDENGNEKDVQIVRIRQEVLSSTSDYNAVFEDYLEKHCLCLSSEILKNERMKGLWPQLFRQLLAWGTKKHNQKTPVNTKAFKSDEMPTRLDGDSVTVSLKDCRKFITFKLLGELGDEEAILEQFGSSEATEDILNFLELLLNKFTEEACTNSEDLFDASQLIMYALGIIGALVEAAATTTPSKLQASHNPSHSNIPSNIDLEKQLNEMWDNLEIFIPHLRKLTQCSQPSLVRQGIPDMASGLLVNIGTRGVKICKGKKDLIKTRFQQAMEDSCNPMVHVKGHGILELRRLVEEKDPETLENETQVLQVFQQNLTNDDSYVYLMSIQGMAALGLRFHKAVVPMLIKEYGFVSSVDNVSDCSRHSFYEKLDNNDRIETRMKVGEILVKVVQKLGDFAPSYRIPLTNVFFRLVRDEEPLIRASTLSNLGELCHLLKFTLGIILTEVWFCVESILTTEKDIHVRRAALHLLVMLLKGVVKDLTVEDILSDNILSKYLRDVRRFLTHTEQTEVDLVAKTHCQLALQELELIVKKLLTPSQSLTYQIKI